MSGNPRSSELESEEAVGKRGEYGYTTKHVHFSVTITNSINVNAVITFCLYKMD